MESDYDEEQLALSTSPTVASRRRRGSFDGLRWSSWFRKSTAAPEMAASDLGGEPLKGLKWDYEQLARETCAKYAIDPREFRIEAVPLDMVDGKQVYVMLMTGTGDGTDSVSRAQLLAPVIERRILSSVSCSWIGDHSIFAGVWTRWPSHLHVPPDVRTALNRAAKRSAGPV